MKKLLVLCLVALAAACDHDVTSEGPCAELAQAGLDVGVTSDQTGQALCDATVTATEGSHAEGLTPTSCRYVGAFERPGTYVVRAEAAGLAAKEVADVRVVAGTGRCPHVRTVLLDIRLSPASVLSVPAETPPPREGCVGTVAAYCARFGGRCPTYEESVERGRAMCARCPTCTVTIHKCAGVYQSVRWREFLLGGGEEYFSLSGRLIAAFLYTDYGAYCNGRSFSQTFGSGLPAGGVAASGPRRSREYSRGGR